MDFKYSIEPQLTVADNIVLGNLLSDIRHRHRKTSSDTNGSEQKSADKPKKEVTPSKAQDEVHSDENDIVTLKAMNDISNPNFQPTIFTTWDATDLHPFLNRCLIAPYTRFAQSLLRHPTDVVFLTHILLYLTAILPSAIYLFQHHNFTWTHGILHTIFTMWCAGPFTLMLHNHIHNNGILRKDVAFVRWADWGVPYVLEPLMGHTWDSYFWHHVKHHHVEGNGMFDSLSPASITAISVTPSATRSKWQE
jgi:hypothetical protein